VVNNRTKRRQRHGSAWYWKQTDSWFYTVPNSKRRVPLLDDQGKRIHGQGNKKAAQLALARVRLKGGLKPATDAIEVAPAPSAPWSVARVCSGYLEHCQRAVAGGRMHPEHRDNVVRYLNELCRYCGALDLTELKRGYVSG